MARTAEDIVRVEVHYCVSTLVSTLASGYGRSFFDTDSDQLSDAVQQALDLSLPVDDWEEAATQAGWEHSDAGHWIRYFEDDVETADTAQGACEIDDIEPYQREVFEHWIVSDWLADRLAEKGEKVDKDFAGLTVWARTTTGQGIASDWVIEQIVADLNKPA